MTGSLPPPEAALVLRTLAVLAIGAWAARPLAARLVPAAGGWGVALLLAWAVIGWVPWALSALWLVPFEAGAFGGLVLLLLLRLKLPSAPPVPWRDTVLAAGAVGLLFWLGLAQRLALADLTGLEKFTDMGLLAASARTSWMPPQDAWFAGESVNYYYVGQAMSAAWGHVAGATPDQAYQIAMALLFALTGVGVWQVTHGVTLGFGRRIAGVLAGAAALLTLYGGNFHSVLYTLFRDWMPATNPAFYYPDSTRFIGYDPPTPDKGFTEFPAYAFAVGDLHAHVIATPVVLLGLLIVLAILARGLRGQAPYLAQGAALGWVLGLCAAINSWDVAVLGLVALIVALMLAVRGGRAAGHLDRLGAAAIVVVASFALTAAPFFSQFTPFASGLEAAPAQTPPWQLLVLYGHALPVLALFGLALLRLPEARGQIGVGLLLAGALLLIALPEVVIARDIYGLDFARANTMFKLTFRAQTLLLIGALAALAPAVARGGAWFAGALGAALPLVALLAYAPYVFAPPWVIRSLDGLDFLGPERGLVAAADALVLAPGEAMIEASGAAFGDTGRVSALTGQPVVIGWAGHEWLWRGDGAAANGRAEAVRRFYTTDSMAERCAVIARYSIRYAVLGAVERQTYPDLNPGAIAALGPALYEGAGGSIVAISPDACR